MTSRPVIQLKPLCGGTYTRLRLCACVPTPLPAWALRQLCALLTLFSGARTRIVLSADEQAVPWCDWWVDSIAKIPEREVSTRFVLKRKDTGREP